LHTLREPTVKYLLTLLLTFFVSFSHTQENELIEEVIVTGIRASMAELPGVTLKRVGLLTSKCIDFK